jgi:hypothetical protein
MRAWRSRGYIDACERGAHLLFTHNKVLLAFCEHKQLFLLVGRCQLNVLEYIAQLFLLQRFVQQMPVYVSQHMNLNVYQLL